MAGLQDFAADVLIKVISDESVQAAGKKLLGSIIAEQILPLVPVAVGAATKAAIDEVSKKFPGAEDLIKGAVDIVHTTDAARNELNNLIPDVDFGIPALDNLMDFWRPKNG
jgi:hypothetical protein